MSHTPVPWHCQPEEGNRSTWEILAGAHPVADVWPGTLGPEAAEANAHFIVRAVNNHEALVDAAEQAQLLLEEIWDEGSDYGAYAESQMKQVLRLLANAIPNTESG